MATMTIQLEVPNTMVWTKDELLAAIKSFASVFVMAKPTAKAVTKDKVACVIDDVKISPELMSYVGIAATSDKRDWKERKEEYLNAQYA